MRSDVTKRQKNACIPAGVAGRCETGRISDREGTYDAHCERILQSRSLCAIQRAALTPPVSARAERAERKHTQANAKLKRTEARNACELIRANMVMSSVSNARTRSHTAHSSFAAALSLHYDERNHTPPRHMRRDGAKGRRRAPSRRRHCRAHAATPAEIAFTHTNGAQTSPLQAWPPRHTAGGSAHIHRIVRCDVARTFTQRFLAGQR